MATNPRPTSRNSRTFSRAFVGRPQRDHPKASRRLCAHRNLPSTRHLGASPCFGGWVFLLAVVLVVVPQYVVLAVYAPASDRCVIDLATDVSVRLFERPFGLDPTGFVDDQHRSLGRDLFAQRSRTDQPFHRRMLDLGVGSQRAHHPCFLAVLWFGVLVDDPWFKPSTSRCLRTTRCRSLCSPLPTTCAHRLQMGGSAAVILFSCDAWNLACVVGFFSTLSASWAAGEPDRDPDVRLSFGSAGVVGAFSVLALSAPCDRCIVRRRSLYGMLDRMGASDGLFPIRDPFAPTAASP